MKDWEEPEIFVQGTQLTTAQAMTVRVCLELSRGLSGASLKALDEVLALMRGPVKEE